jgi:hypothetical protein
VTTIWYFIQLLICFPTCKSSYHFHTCIHAQTLQKKTKNKKQKITKNQYVISAHLDWECPVGKRELEPYVQYTISAKQDNNWEASWISSLPTIIATMEKMHAICCRQNMKPWKQEETCIRVANKCVCVCERERERERERGFTMMQLSHCVVCILNWSCNKNRVEATEFPKQRKTCKIKHVIIKSLIAKKEALYDYLKS